MIVLDVLIFALQLWNLTPRKELANLFSWIPFSNL
jgi:hypothetical protein